MMRNTLEPSWIYSIKKKISWDSYWGLWGKKKNSIWDKQQSSSGLKSLIYSIHGKKIHILPAAQLFYDLKRTAEKATPAF